MQCDSRWSQIADKWPRSWLSGLVGKWPRGTCHVACQVQSFCEIDMQTDSMLNSAHIFCCGNRHASTLSLQWYFGVSSGVQGSNWGIQTGFKTSNIWSLRHCSNTVHRLNQVFYPPHNQREHAFRQCMMFVPTTSTSLAACHVSGKAACPWLTTVSL